MGLENRARPMTRRKLLIGAGITGLGAIGFFEFAQTQENTPEKSAMEYARAFLDGDIDKVLALTSPTWREFNAGPMGRPSLQNDIKLWSSCKDVKLLNTTTSLDKERVDILFDKQCTVLWNPNGTTPQLLRRQTMTIMMEKVGGKFYPRSVDSPDNN